MKKKKLLELVGAWEDAPEMDSIFDKIFEERHTTKDRKIKF